MTLEERLNNWGRAWRDGGHRRTLARSVESRARSVIGQEVEWETGEWIGEGPPKRTPPRIDVVDAIAVELAICSLPLYDHAVLRGWYVFRWQPWTVLKRAREVARRWPVAANRGRARDFEQSLLFARVHAAEQLLIAPPVHRARTLAWVRRVLGTGLTPVNVAVD